MAFTGCVIEDPETLLQIDNLSNAAIGAVEIRVNNLNGNKLTDINQPGLIPAQSSKQFPMGVGTYYLKVTGSFTDSIIFTTTEGNTTVVEWDGRNLRLKGAAPQLKVTITGLTAYNGKLAYLDLSTSSASNTSVAWDSGTISNGSITFDMLDYVTDDPFKTTGTYYVVLLIGSSSQTLGDDYEGYITSRAFTATTNLMLTNFTSTAPAKGTLVVKNAATTLNDTDWIIEIIVKDSKGAATTVVKETVELKLGQTKSYQLDPGSYYVRVNSEETVEDFGFWDIENVTVVAGQTVTVVWDGSGNNLTIDGGAPAPTRAATPTSNKPAGNLLTTDTITLSCTTPGATIRYTTNGNSPTSTSTAYSTPFTLPAGTVTVKAKVFPFGNYLESEELSVTYTVSAPKGTLTVKNEATTVAASEWIIEIVVMDTPAGGTVTEVVRETVELKLNQSQSYELEPGNNYYVRVNSNETVGDFGFWFANNVPIQAGKTTTVTWDGSGTELAVGTPQ
jgi:hypothetical protein